MYFESARALLQLLLSVGRIFSDLKMYLKCTGTEDNANYRTDYRPDSWGFKYSNDLKMKICIIFAKNLPSLLTFHNVQVNDFSHSVN